MFRVAAVLVIILGMLSALTMANAYQIAQPTSPASVTVKNANAAVIALSPGSGDAFGWVQGTTGGNATIDFRGAAGTYAFDPTATYTMGKVLRVTNTSGSGLNISVTASSTHASVNFASGYLNGATAATSPFLLGSGQYVDIDISVTTGASTGNAPVTFTVSAN